MIEEKYESNYIVPPQYEVFASEYLSLNLCRVILQEKVGNTALSVNQANNRHRYQVNSDTT